MKRALVVGCALAVAAGCDQSPATATVRPSYDVYTGRLIQLAADQDGDGRLDQWTYLEGSRPLRGEKDADNDGRIDRWEYFDAEQRLVTVGTASRNDGIEDTWTMADRVNEEGRIDVSTGRDRVVDRHEYYRGDTLVRVELDTNADGHIDRWDRYENGVLRDVQFDTTLAGARADRRLLFDAQGRFAAAEGDDDRDGQFVRLAPGSTPVPPGGTVK